VVPETLGEKYRALMNEHMGTLSDRLVSNGIDYCRFVTSTPLDHALFEYLSRRERMSRIR